MGMRGRRLGFGSGVLLAVGLALWSAWITHRSAVAPPRMVYSAAGYGGYVPAPSGGRADKEERKAAETAGTVDPVRPAMEAYDRGDYPKAETLAAAVIRTASPPSPHAGRGASFSRVGSGVLPTPSRRTPPRLQRSAGPSSPPSTPAVRTRAFWVMAYSAAREHDLTRARHYFAALQREAARVEEAGSGDQPTLGEEGAYEHAVCTGALGDHPAAEREYRAFLRRYPESPLVQAAVKRIALFHHGDIPKAAEADWKAAMQIQQQRARSQARQAALCGPACLAELLRRRSGSEGAPVVGSSSGQASQRTEAKPDVHALANEMKTDYEGTTLEALSAAVKKRGFSGRGLVVTTAGLLQQRTPFIALLNPGHYVLVDAVRAEGVTIWDSDALGPNRPGRRTLDYPTWSQLWDGVLLTLR